MPYTPDQLHQQLEWLRNRYAILDDMPPSIRKLAERLEQEIKQVARNATKRA
jgi:hypothetical protein